MTSTRALGELRVAAALTHAIPGLRTVVRVDGVPHLEVAGAAAAGPGGEPATAGPTARLRLSPCAFRRSVAEAHGRATSGRPVRWAGLPEGVDPEVEVLPPPPGRRRPGGLVRVPLVDRWLWAFGTTLDPVLAYDLGLPVVEARIADLCVQSLGIRPDAATGVSIAFAELRVPTTHHDEARAVEVLEDLMATWTAHDLLTAAGAHRRTTATPGG